MKIGDNHQRLIAMVGLPGSGKTTIAAMLAETTGFAVISRDVIREAMFNPCSFSDVEKTASFQAMLLALRASLQLRRSCIIDGMPFSKRSQIELVRSICEEYSVTPTFLYLELPVRIAQERVRRDIESGMNKIGDRSEALVQIVSERFERLPEYVATLDATKDPRVLLEQAIRTVYSN